MVDSVVNPPEFGRRFDGSQPPFGTLLVSQKVRTNIQALERANELRTILGIDPTTGLDWPSLSGGTALNLHIESGNYAVDGQSTKFWPGGFTPDYGTPGWPAIVNPGYYRTDAIVITSSGNLLVSIGAESAFPAPAAAAYPSDVVPIAEVTILEGTTTFNSPDVTIRDVRPMYVISAAGFGINPKEETQYAISGQTVFNLLTIAYTPGQSEINVYVGGVRKNVGEDYSESGISQITFFTGLPLNEKVTVWKVGAASSHRLADLDDVNVPTADAVIDTNGIRTTSYAGSPFSNAFIAAANNPFATLADVSSITSSIPFGVEHNAVTGQHGPRVNITQPNADNALVVTKTNADGSAAMVLTNSGSGVGIYIVQTGAGRGVFVQQYGNSDAIQVAHLSTATNTAPVSVSRVVSATREPLLILRDNTTLTTGVNVSVLGHELTFANESNERTFAFEAGTGTLTIQGSSNSARLVVNHTSAGAGRSMEVVHLGTSDAVRINNSGSEAALVLNNTSTKTVLVIKGTASAYLEPLWGGKFGPVTNADTYHTHTPAALNAGTGIALVELNDVDTNLSSAITDASTLRASPATSANPLSTMADIQAQIPRIKVDSYTGNGTSLAVAVGFQPDWVQLYNDSDNTQSGAYIANGSTGRFFKNSGLANITITLTGFTLNNGTAPLNQLGVTYHYIAYKSNP